jgi:predicted dehydrogenase
MTNTQRIGILGAARIAPIAMIAPAKGRPDVEVRAVAARDPERARHFAGVHRIAVAEKDYASLIARDDIDLVYIALPPSLHAEWSIRAMEAGKAVLCEKPFSMSERDAQQMVDASAATGRPLIEAFHYRFHPVMKRLESMVAEGALGPIERAEVIFDGAVSYPDTLWTAALGCGALTDIGCYAIDALRTLFGEPAVDSADWELKHDAFARVDARMRFPGGVAARMSCAMIDGRPSGVRRCWIRLEGSRGSAHVTNFVVPHFLGSKFTTVIDGVEQTNTFGSPSTYDVQLSHVVNVMTGKEQPLTGGHDAIANMRIVDAIRRVTGYADGVEAL